MTSVTAVSPLGFVLIDKPAGCTSHDVVAKVRRALQTRRVGHAGTLDPMATGVLVLGVGSATRLLSLASTAAKTYTATIRLGQSTSTDDAEGDVVATTNAAGVTEAAVRSAAGQFVGEIWQRPSSVSAIKVAGKRAYDRVRAGEDVTLAARQVTVDSFDVLDVRPGGQSSEFLEVAVRVRCGTGTYIRALARDLGENLGTGGHLRRLRRVESAGIDVADCMDLEAFVANPVVHPVRSVIARWLPVYDISADLLGRLTQGQQVPWEPTGGAGELAAPSAAVAGPDGEVGAIVTVTHDTLRPTVVLANTAKR